MMLLLFSLLYIHAADIYFLLCATLWCSEYGSAWWCCVIFVCLPPCTQNVLHSAHSELSHKHNGAFFSSSSSPHFFSVAFFLVVVQASFIRFSCKEFVMCVYALLYERQAKMLNDVFFSHHSRHYVLCARASYACLAQFFFLAHNNL